MDGQASVIHSLFTCETTLSSEQEIHVNLPQLIAIHPDQKYEIQLEQHSTKEHFNQVILKKELELKDGIKIRFLQEGTGYDDSKYGLITKLYFKRV